MYNYHIFKRQPLQELWSEIHDFRIKTRYPSQANQDYEIIDRLLVGN